LRRAGRFEPGLWGRQLKESSSRRKRKEDHKKKGNQKKCSCAYWKKRYWGSEKEVSFQFKGKSSVSDILGVGVGELKKEAGEQREKGDRDE